MFLVHRFRQDWDRVTNSCYVEIIECIQGGCSNTTGELMHYPDFSKSRLVAELECYVAIDQFRLCKLYCCYPFSATLRLVTRRPRLVSVDIDIVTEYANIVFSPR